MLKPEKGSGRDLAPIDDRRRSGRGDESDRRSRPRRRVMLAAVLETPEGDRDVKMRNLSSTGALFELDRAPPVGTLVTFRRGNTIAPGTVVWASGSAVGVNFIRPIHESEVLIHTPRPGAIF